jgi:hypothetical protein
VRRARRRGPLAGLCAATSVFEEEARTGANEDADPTRRHVVRLAIEPTLLEIRLPRPGRPDQPGEAPAGDETRRRDALPFLFCLSGRTDAEHGRRYVDGVTVARGNVVLADHGRTITDDQPLGGPPSPRLRPCRRDTATAAAAQRSRRWRHGSRLSSLTGRSRRPRA